MKNNGDAGAVVGEGRRGRLLERPPEFGASGRQRDLTPKQTEADGCLGCGPLLVGPGAERRRSPASRGPSSNL